MYFSTSHQAYINSTICKKVALQDDKKEMADKPYIERPKWVALLHWWLEKTEEVLV